MLSRCVQNMEYNPLQSTRSSRFKSNVQKVHELSFYEEIGSLRNKESSSSIVQ